jgi:hypothetical protein
MIAETSLVPFSINSKIYLNKNACMALIAFVVL